MRCFARVSLMGWVATIAVTMLVLTGTMAAQAPSAPAHLRGGAKGVVKTTTGRPVAGMMVQLISDATAIRTTAYTTESGAYEFPRLPGGAYTLRLARPLEYKPYWKDGVQINGATALPDIVAERISTSQFIPPNPEVLPQLSGSEWVATHSEPDSCGSTSGFGGMNWEVLIRSATMSGRAVAPLIWTPSFQ